METNWNPPFSLLGWSIATLVVFIVIQASITVAYGIWGHRLSPAVGLFTWAAVSGALAYAILARHHAETRQSHLLLQQAMACFYVFAISCAILLRSDAPLALANLGGSVIAAAALFAAGYLGIWVATNYFDWRRTS